MLTVACAGVLAVWGLLLAGLARGLGVRLPRAVVAVAVLVPLLYLLPWLVRTQDLGSTDFLTRGLVPGTEESAEAGRWELVNDPALQFLPWEMELRRLWRSGGPGFWSDSLEGGSSPWANPQAAVLSPVAWVARLFPVRHFLLVKFALQMALVLLGVAVLVRRLGGGWWSAALGGLAAALGGAVVPWGLFTHAAAAGWVPWTTTGLLVLARRPRPRVVAATAVAIACLLTAGHPEVAFAGGCLGGVVALSLRARRVPWRAHLGATALATVLGFGLASPVLLPFLHAVAGSQRAQEMAAATLPDLTGLGRDPRSWFDDDTRRLLLTPLHPSATGVPFLTPFTGSLNWLESGAAFAGLWALGGAALALGLGLRRALPLVLFGGLALLVAAGFLPLVWLLRHLPAFDALAFPRALLVGTMAWCVAAALAYEDLRRRQASALAWLVLGAVVAASFVAGGLHHLTTSVVCWGALAVALVGGDPSSSRGRRGSVPSPRWIMALVVAIVVAQAPWAWRMTPSSSRASFYPPSAVFDALAVAAGPGEVPGRVLGTEFLGYPSLLSVYGFHQTRSHNPMASADRLEVLRRALGFEPGPQRYFAPVERLDGRWLDRLGVTAVLTTVNSPLHEAGLRQAGLERFASRHALPSGFEVWTNPDALPRWWVAGSWTEGSGPGSATGTTVVVEETATTEHGAAPPGEEVGARSAAGGDVGLELVRYRPGSVELAVRSFSGAPAPAEGFLLATSLPGPTGWRVSVRRGSGAWRPVQVIRVDGAFLGARVPAGATGLRLAYRPRGVLPGVLLATLSVVALAWLVRRGDRARGAVR